MKIYLVLHISFIQQKYKPPVFRHFPYSRDFVVSPVSRHLEKVGRLKSCIAKIVRYEGWKVRRLEGLKAGRLEGWEVGRLEG